MGGGSNQKTTTGPTKEMAPYYQDLFGSAGKAYAATPKTPYTGEFYADPNQTQFKAVSDLLGQVPGLGTGVDQIRQYAMDVLGGKFLDPSTNPWLGGAITAATRPVEQQFQRVTVPSINDAAIRAGAYGGGRQGAALGVAGEGLGRTTGDIASAMTWQNYAKEREMQQAVPALFGQANQLALMGPQATAAAGEQLQQWDQQQIDEAIAKWNEAKTAPWSGLGQYANILGTGGFNTQTTKLPQASPMQQFMQTALGLPALASMF